MSFTSIIFFVFLIILFSLYWSFKQYKMQNIIILIASYVFYCLWDWRCAFLLAFTTLCSYFSGLIIEKHVGENKRIWRRGSLEDQALSFVL